MTVFDPAKFKFKIVFVASVTAEAAESMGWVRLTVPPFTVVVGNPARVAGKVGALKDVKRKPRGAAHA